MCYHTEIIVARHNYVLAACDNVEEGGALTWSNGENGAGEWNSSFKTLSCYFYRSHMQQHAQRGKGNNVLPVSAPTPCRFNKHHGGWRPCHYFEHTSLACPSATFTSQWVIVPITSHFPFSGDLSCVVAVRVQYPAAWHSTHYGLMEVKVFLWLSLAQSGATQVSLRGPYYEWPRTNTYRYTHTPGFTHVSHLVEIMGFCTLSPRTLLCASIMGPNRNNCSGIAFIETPNCCKLLPISLNWSVKS